MRLCFASNNAHKLDEIRLLLPPGLVLLSLADIGCHEELPETRDTLEGNARQKAEYDCFIERQRADNAREVFLRALTMMTGTSN